MDGWSRLAHAPEPHQLSKEGPSMAEVRTPEGVIVRVTGRPPELFLRIITPSGREFGWPVHAGTIGYDVAKEVAGLASEGEPVSLSDGRKRKSAAQGH